MAEAEKNRAWYEQNGWPELLNKSELVLYTGLNKSTLDKYFLSREDAPVFKIDRGILVDREAWQAFMSAVMLGKRYAGHKDVIYEEM